MLPSRHFRDWDDFEISAGEKNRALRLKQALVTEADPRGHPVKPSLKTHGAMCRSTAETWDT